MTAFHDAIERAIVDGNYPTPVPLHALFPRPAADAVLAMPEMQAIKAQFRTMVDDLINGCNDAVNHGQHGTYTAEESRRWYLSDHLPEDVIAWVLDDQETQP